MAATTIEQEIIEAIQKLDSENQRRVLEYARSLRRPKGISGKEFLERTKDIHISPEDLDLMQKAIEEEFERVDPIE
jgi:hypothetical protein